MTRPDDHVCPPNERCSECHSVPIHILHRSIIERGDLRLTEPTQGDPLFKRDAA